MKKLFTLGWVGNTDASLNNIDFQVSSFVTANAYDDAKSGNWKLEIYTTL